MTTEKRKIKRRKKISSSSDIIFFRDFPEEYSEIHLTRDEVEHLKSLRLFQIDKTIEIRNGKGECLYFHVQSGEKRGNLLSKEFFEDTRPQIKIASAIPKSQKLDLILQKGTELGVTHFYFINFLQSERKEFNPERAKRIFEESSSQSGRIYLPEFFIFSSIKDFIIKNKNHKIIYLDPDSDEVLSKETIANSIPVIGPEGGFREEEKVLLEESGARGFRAGEEIMRIETGFLFAASILRFINL
jgi:16S rRNA (uracil1498-N3)-methyltransferase